MDDLLFARLQMGISLGFHIIFAAIGIAMPVLMVMAEWRRRRTQSPIDETLTKRWAMGTAIFFAVGAVSGTVLSFELGLLWPTFMEHAGGIIGVPFGLEGFAFFTEAIFLGIFLYGWKRVPSWVHLTAGVLVAISGAASAGFVIMVNGWMNAPTGFEYDPATNTFSNIDPIAAMFNPAWLAQSVHMLIAAYMATGFAVAGVHALQLLRGRDLAFHRRGLFFGMVLAAPMAIVQPIAGDWISQIVVENQPAKFAAMEGHFETQTSAPIHIGGWPDEDAGEMRSSIEIPGMLSLLAYRDVDAEVMGLDQVPRDEWPPIAITHMSFQVMVALGVIMLVTALWWIIAAWRRRGSERRLPRGLLWMLVICAPLGFIAIEAGWTVTEVGRQPWTIWRIMRTEDAVTPMPGLVGPFILFTLVYLGLALAVIYLMRRQVRMGTEAAIALEAELRHGH